MSTRISTENKTTDFIVSFNENVQITVEILSLSLSLSMVLQPCGSWPLLRFRNPIHNRSYVWTKPA
jgi:hypothetical protein